MIIYISFCCRRDYINVITRNSYCNEIQNGRFLFSFLYNRNNRTERSILNPTYSNIEFKKKENCKRTRWIAQAEATARELGDYFIIVECRSLGWAGLVRNRNVAIRAKVRKAGLFGSAISFTKLAAFRQIESDRFTVESCKSCTSARRYHPRPPPRLFPRAAQEERRGSPVFAKKLIEKLIFGRVRPPCTGHFHSIRPPRLRSAAVCPLVCTL